MAWGFVVPGWVRFFFDLDLKCSSGFRRSCNAGPDSFLKW
jgi:hypothetical protein